MRLKHGKNEYIDGWPLSRRLENFSLFNKWNLDQHFGESYTITRETASDMRDEKWYWIAQKLHWRIVEGYTTVLWSRCSNAGTYLISQNSHYKHYYIRYLPFFVSQIAHVVDKSQTTSPVHPMSMMKWGHKRKGKPHHTLVWGYVG